MRLNIVLVSMACLISTAAFADQKYTCTDPTTKLTNTLTVTGTGTSATVHIQNPYMDGDVTYNDSFTQASGQTGYVVFTGTMTDELDNPPSQLEGAFLFQPALLNGGTGSMEQMGPDSFMTLSCVKAQ